MSKIALIIGGTGGLRRGTAELLAQKDCIIIVAGRNADQGAEVVSAITSAGGNASFLAVDRARAVAFVVENDWTVGSVLQIDVGFLADWGGSVCRCGCDVVCRCPVCEQGTSMRS